MPITLSSPPSAVSPLNRETRQETQTKPSSGFHLWGDDGFSFGDILDILNPLQHLPIVSTVYRAVTGKDIAPASRVLGDGLFGGPIGAAVGAANAFLKYVSGKDSGEHVLALLDIPTQPEDESLMVAKASAPPSSLPSTLSLSAVVAATRPESDNNARLTRAADQARALDAYARNSRLLAAPQIRNPYGVRF